MSMKVLAGGGKFGRSRQPSDNEVDFTSLIDVVFLLLIFFMVSSTMSGQEDVPVPEAKHGEGVDPSASVIITLAEPSKPGGTAVIHLGDGTSAPTAELDEVKAYLEQGIREQKRGVILKAGKNVEHGEVMAVARIVGEFEGLTFHLGVEETK